MQAGLTATLVFLVECHFVSAVIGVLPTLQYHIPSPGGLGNDCKLSGNQQHAGNYHHDISHGLHDDQERTEAEAHVLSRTCNAAKTASTSKSSTCQSR